MSTTMVAKLTEGNNDQTLSFEVLRLKAKNVMKSDKAYFSTKSVLKNLQLFTNSELPKQAFYYQNGKWNVFPEHITQNFQMEFHMKRSYCYVIYENHSLLIDFVHMVCIDITTESSKPIAWIDENDVLFVPDISNSNENEISAAESSNNELEEEEESVCENDKIGENAYDNGPNNVMVQNMFVHGLRSFTDVGEVEIVNVSYAPEVNNEGQVRYDLFRKQCEEVERVRRNANVRYAWLACRKDAVLSLLWHGVLKIESCLEGHHSYGAGVHLAPVKSSNVGAISSEPDEDGISHMMLCRVIMGSVELVQRGSEMWEPSNENYDSGVDNLHSPKHYIVWHKYVDTHIYPEYVVSFKLPAKAKEILAGNENMLIESAFPNLGSFHQASSSHANISNQQKMSQFGRVPKLPTSPWISFSMLFAAISSKIPTQDFDLLNGHYEEFKRRKIDRPALIRKLKHVIGDKLLISIVKSLQHKLPKVAPPCPK